MWSVGRATRRFLIIHRRFIVVSGLPASGKSTLAKQVAAAFGLPLYDKDDILEALFDTMGPIDLALRQRLSRASDRVLTKLVRRSFGAVVTSFWRHQSDRGNSGTPSKWLHQLSPSIVEVYCKCPPEVAVQRFLSRVRHRGHHDTDRTCEALLTQFRQVEARGPLGVGNVVTADTSAYPSADPLIREIMAVFAQIAETLRLGRPD